MEPLRPHIMLCLIACLFLTIEVTDGNDFCTVQAPKTGDPSIPKIDYSYSAQIVGKWFDTKNTKLIHEYYEKDKYLASNHLQYGERFIRIHNLKNNNTIYFADDLCFKMKVKTPKEQAFEVVELRLDLGHVWRYEKATTIKGIKVKEWSTCVLWPDRSNFTAHYYFTMENVPFRIEMDGLELDYKGGKRKFHAIFDYFLFTKGSPPKEVFNIPPGYFCKNTTLKVTPPMVMSATFSMIDVDMAKKTIAYRYVGYDKERQLTEIFGESKTNVHDFKRGIKFEIDRKAGKCTRHALNRFIGSDKTVDKSGIDHIATLQHFLFAEGNFTYNGVHKARGIPCNVYTRVSQSGISPGVSVLELYFAISGVKVHNSEESVSLASQPPVRVLFKGGQGINKVAKRQLDIYDFVPKDTSSTNYMRIALCFDDHDTIKFKLILKGKYIPNGKDYWKFRAEITTKVKDVISSALEINYLRVDVLSFKSNSGQIELRSALYGPEDPITRFQTVLNRKIATQFQSKDVLTYKNQSNTPTICSDYCADHNSRPDDFKIKSSYPRCDAFEFDRGNKDCTFYFTSTYVQGKKDDNLSYSVKIDFYRRMQRSYNHWVSLYGSWRNLHKYVSQGLINVTDSKGHLFKADSVTKIFKSTDDNGPKKQISDDNPMSQFEDISELGMLSSSPVETVYKISYYACARHCLTTLKYNCEAFQRESDKTTCKFYDSSAVRKFYSKEKPKKAFARLYLSNFEEIPGRSMLSSDKDTVYTDVTDSNACAELCSKEYEFYCQSFELCGQTCLLGRNHIYNTPPSKVKESYNCVHYSRNYIQDYIKQSNKKALSDSNVVELSNVGVKKCASLCSTSSKYNCNAFEFCDSDSICRVSTKSVKNSGDLSYKKSGACDIYFRKHGRNRFINSYSELTSSHDGGHSPGAMGGISIGMIVVGMLLVLVVVVLILKLRSRGINESSIGFSKRHLDEE